MLPNDGVGLARMEFIISEHIGIHPMALVDPEKVTSAGRAKAIEQLVRNYATPSDYFIEKLSEGVGTIAAAFYPKPVIVRLSDFKTNEYAKLVGGEGFEPKEENPMLGFRGAARYAHPAYAAGFALECAALRRVREDMGLTNVRIMVPFCRRVEEARRVHRCDGQQRSQARRKRPRNLRHVRNSQQRHPDRRFRKVVRRLLDRLERSDPAHPGRGPGFRDRRVRFRRARSRHAGDAQAGGTGAKRNGRHVGICGEAPANYPEIARYLAQLGIDSISVNPSSILRTMQVVSEAEAGKLSKIPAE